MHHRFFLRKAGPLYRAKISYLFNRAEGLTWAGTQVLSYGLSGHNRVAYRPYFNGPTWDDFFGGRH